MRIVAADDDEGMARTLARCLRSWGYDPLVVRDGHEAWRILKQEDSPRVVILDWDMPGLSGLEVCRLLRTTPHGRDVYVLMLTARQEKRDIIEALECGADDFLAKPFHTRELQLRLAKGVRNSARESTVGSTPRPDAPPAGTTLGGKYRLEKMIAKGGMGSVWLGAHLALGVNVAIKFMDPVLAETAAYASFEREARAAAQLRNEHIVRVYDHGIDQHGLPYLVMEYLGGESLGARVDSDGPFAPADVASFVEQAARALTDAHAHGIVHHDIKPENIVLLDDSERECGFSVKLIDFGLAAPGTAHPDPSGGIAGTPHYMSPEYLRGSVKADPFLDLWALAVTAYVALTARAPFEGDTVDEIYRRVSGEPPAPSAVNPAVPPSVDAWFRRACAREPSARFQTAAELGAALAVACRDADGRRSGLGPLKSSGTYAPTEPDSSAASASRARSSSS